MSHCAGAGFALSLMLNIEQYESTRGQHDEAGVKILLHDPSEAPLIQEFGFAIAPGTDTLVGVRREKVSTKLEATVILTPPPLLISAKGDITMVLKDTGKGIFGLRGGSAFRGVFLSIMLKQGWAHPFVCIV